MRSIVITTTVNEDGSYEIKRFDGTYARSTRSEDAAYEFWGDAFEVARRELSCSDNDIDIEGW